MKPECALFAVTLDDGSVAILSYITSGRGSILPDGAAWLDQAKGLWERPVRDDLVFGEVLRAFPGYQITSKPGEYVVAKPVSWRRVQPSEIPADRTYRDALVDAGSLAHDMPKAREIHRRMLRHARAPLLAALDVEAMRADEGRNTTRKAEVAAEKQRLRDVTAAPEIEAAKTIDELKAVTLGLL